MNFFREIALFLESTMQSPVPYGWYHILSLVLIFGLTIFMAVKFKNASDKTNKKILLTFSIIMLVLEVYKQIFFVSYNAMTNVWDYSWYAFPFQFCSVPMYVMFIAALSKKGKFQDALFAFLGTYAVFAGLAVLLYPGDVFTSMIGINIQTMVHHGFMFVIGVYMLASGRAKLEAKTILKALPVFVVIVLIALGMNFLTHLTGITGTETFNMFFISPYFNCTLPVLGMIYNMVPYVVFLLIYIIGFTFVAGLMLFIAMALKSVKNVIIKNCKKRKAC